MFLKKIRIDGKNFEIICQTKPKSDPKKEKYSVISFQLYLFVCFRLRIYHYRWFCYRLSIALIVNTRKPGNYFFFQPTNVKLIHRWIDFFCNWICCVMFHPMNIKELCLELGVNNSPRMHIRLLLTSFDLSSPVHWHPSLGHVIKRERIFLSVALSAKVSCNIRKE